MLNTNKYNNVIGTNIDNKTVERHGQCLWICYHITNFTYKLKYYPYILQCQQIENYLKIFAITLDKRKCKVNEPVEMLVQSLQLCSCNSCLWGLFSVD